MVSWTTVESAGGAQCTVIVTVLSQPAALVSTALCVPKSLNVTPFH